MYGEEWSGVCVMLIFRYERGIRFRDVFDYRGLSRKFAFGWVFI